MTAGRTALDAWLDDARKRVEATPLAPVAEQVGRVDTVGDGIALVTGLSNVGLNELLRFERSQVGFAITLDRDRLGCVLLDESEAIEAGDLVCGTGDVVRVPIGPGLLGRTVDPLGRPLDGETPINAEAFAPMERAAPAIVDRDFVSEPVQTGLLAIDSMFALGARSARIDPGG